MSKKQIYKILICVLCVIAISVTAIFVHKNIVNKSNTQVSENANEGAEDNKASIVLSGEAGEEYTYSINGSGENLNLYCAKHGGKLSHRVLGTHTQKAWSLDAGVFKNQNAYNEMNWILKNLWYDNSTSNSSARYTNEELFSIMSSEGVTEDDIKEVFGDKEDTFLLYQAITWAYTNGTSSNLDSKLGESGKKVYDAIRHLAKGKTYGEPKITVKADPNVTLNSEGTNYVWNNVEITSNVLLDYKLVVRVDGRVLDEKEYEFKDNTIIFKGIKNGNHTFSVAAGAYYIACDATVWGSDNLQPFIQITGSNRITASAEANAKSKTEVREIVEPCKFTLKLHKVNPKTNNNINGVTLSVTNGNGSKWSNQKTENGRSCKYNRYNSI